MAINAGVWIDHRQAIVVLASDAGKKITRIASGFKSADHSSSKHKYTPNDFVAEDRLQRKFTTLLKTFYDEVIACVRDAEAILIMGPGEAKGQFIKRLKSKAHRSRIVDLETTDKMTDRQLAAKVDLHFAKSTAKKSATPKANRKNAARTVSGKRAKKSGR